LESGTNLVMYDVYYLLWCCCLWDQNTWNTFPVSEYCTMTIIIRHNQLLNN
jgi:hypothetical protein